ncbi:MAG: hypothetical protein IPP94_13935 [Ignavibacteria bacterium]|nr:hypothetical protein [Ignavibacteria bacterium]
MPVSVAERGCSSACPSAMAARANSTTVEMFKAATAPRYTDVRRTTT